MSATATYNTGIFNWSNLNAFEADLINLRAELVDKGWRLTNEASDSIENFIHSKGYLVTASKGSRIFCYRSSWTVQSTQDVAIFDAATGVLTRYKR